MTSVYALHRDLSMSTAVELTATAHFTSPDDINLLVVKQNILDIYTLTPPTPPSHPTPHPPHLLLLHSLPLFGSIASLQPLRLPGYSRDSLLLSFLDCKLSLLHYSPATRDLVTLDTAIFESLRDLTPASSQPCLTSTLPLLRVDPLHRCFSLLAYSSTLFVFPLDSAPPPEPSSLSPPPPYLGPIGLLHPFPIPFSHPSLHPPSDPTAPLTSLIDFAFLSGYNSPTLLLLHHHPHTWEGRYAAHRHTAQLLTITLDLASRTFLVLARTALTLPYDTHALYPLPAPHGGALVFSNHLTFHFSNQHIDYTMATNTYGDVDGKYHSEQSGVVVNLHLTAVSTLYSTAAMIQLLLGTRDGQLLLMTVETAGTGVRLMQMRKLAVSAISSAISTLERRASSAYVFIGSRVGSSLLLELRERSEEEMREEVREQERQEDERNREREQREKERQRLLRGEDEALQAMADQAKAQADEEYDDIFGISLSTDREREAQRREVRARAKEETSRQFEVVVRDAMIGVAPCVDFVISQDKQRPVELVAISGQGQQGAITLHSVSTHTHAPATGPRKRPAQLLALPLCWLAHRRASYPRRSPSSRWTSDARQSAVLHLSRLLPLPSFAQHCLSLLPAVHVQRLLDRASAGATAALAEAKARGCGDRCSPPCLRHRPVHQRRVEHHSPPHRRRDHPGRRQRLIPPRRRAFPPHRQSLRLPRRRPGTPHRPATRVAWGAHRRTLGGLSPSHLLST